MRPAVSIDGNGEDGPVTTPDQTYDVIV
ncbi:MAG: hypothetical protein JWR70_757, partial [Modestobacter sp.]|nr:hypothetical protein [Modestobacter sp.]